ncbi:MAG: oxidoreductase [Alphaproteobacteria bacterium]|nr:oxidoreductase [Alphaproteobacteria bacterium]
MEKTKTSISGKTAVVTGASRGIGYATALELGKRGAHVIAIARTIGGLEELDDEIKKAGGTATLVPLDITDTKALQALGPSLLSRFPKIDIVIGAAGYLDKLTPVAQGPLEQWTRALATNATANITLIQTLHPLLKQSENPTAIFLTENNDNIGRAFFGFYGASKAALEALVTSYAAENPGINISLYAPSPTETRLREEAFPGGNKNQLQNTETVAKEILKKLVD